jgi:hypothetical protein
LANPLFASILLKSFLNNRPHTKGKPKRSNRLKITILVRKEDLILTGIKGDKFHYYGISLFAQTSHNNTLLSIFGFSPKIRFQNGFKSISKRFQNGFTSRDQYNRQYKYHIPLFRRGIKCIIL